MAEHFVAVTQLELADPAQPNVRLSPPRLASLVLVPGQIPLRLDMAWPASGADADRGIFATSTLCDLDGDGVPELVYAVTPASGACYLLKYVLSGGTWHAVPIAGVADFVTIVRSIAAGDVDGDGRPEIVIGTRPNGAVMVFDLDGAAPRCTLVDRDQYGAGTTNTREVAIADADADGRLEILVATARADEQKWEPTPGAIFLYRFGDDGWRRHVIDDHGGHTHSRMVAVAPINGADVPQVISCTVGTVSPASDAVTYEPELRLYTLAGDGVETETIETLTGMIKSRSFAVGDVDQDGRSELVVGTRAVEIQGLGGTALYLYRRDDAGWRRETLDTSGPLGFHCVAIGDVDGDGRDEVVASDDARGQIKMYKKTADGWAVTVLHDAGVEIFCAAIHIGAGPPA